MTSPATERSVVERFVMCFNQWRHHREYTYGFIINIDGTTRCVARNKKGRERVEFVLWEIGEQDHDELYWREMGYGWELQFKPYDT